MNATPVDADELAVASALVLVNALLALPLDARLARTVVVAGLRAVVQLLLVGFVLRAVFALRSPWLVGLVVLTMMMSAGHEVFARQERRFAGPWGFGLGAATTLLSTLLVGAFALALLRPQPWYDPRVAIPIIGILLGSAMNGVGISLNAFNAALARERAAIEAQLALGATRQAALRPLLRTALRSGMIPIVNQMSAAGIVTLPGMMTGQIIAGMSPLDAAKYQILVLLLLSGGTGLGAFATLALAARRATDGRHRLRLDRLGG